MSARSGFPINWDANPLDTAITQHPLYTKYNLQTFGAILKADVIADLSAIRPTTESSGICAYLSWLIRTLNLLA